VIWLQALPLLVLVLLLASGRAGPFVACGAALASALPAIVATVGGPALPDFVAVRTTEAAWLALPPVGIVLGGLLFHAAVRRPPGTEPSRDVVGAAFVAAFLLGRRRRRSPRATRCRRRCSSCCCCRCSGVRRRRPVIPCRSAAGRRSLRGSLRSARS